ncbi:DUF218 domain [Acinetobacter baumannii]|uniref:ElyC/SanA/YdcF family protein n=1 Tax=Acinetobacter baumannii TaxID=470 RepID=UPI000E1B4B7C|nr:ElyC/SanA/YdcF family protein [Acinetobacter baumannii]SUV72969.1 DUF218 domain [Acinetobacter baumannii]
MQAWLKARGVDAKLLEKRSMNTVRILALVHVTSKERWCAYSYVGQDEYHMPRTRRLFALNGIETILLLLQCNTAYTLATEYTNYDHSRRANYELLATIRDIYLVQVIVERCLNV